MLKPVLWLFGWSVMNWTRTAGPSLMTPSNGIGPRWPESKRTTEPASRPLHKTSLQGRKKYRCLFRSTLQPAALSACKYVTDLSVGPRTIRSRWRCSLWLGGASKDQEQLRSRVLLGPGWGEGDRILPTVAFFTVPPHRAAQGDIYISWKWPISIWFPSLFYNIMGGWCDITINCFINYASIN